ncbi:hypothetical protein CSAL01_02147 [Colletotrichum salicis]|uniref:Uncharacterized protein n=1 Tax=Colletotrichum salicis TaxID=1209931 RepID=A0A135UUE5_9PEZI|nr:hypothetical protein CSAL01_02147 [Colletotrichum salicis]
MLYGPYPPRGYWTLSSDSFDVSSESNASDTAFGPPAMPVPLSIGISTAGRRHARCAQHARFQQAAVAQNPLARGTVRRRRSYRLPTGLPLERPDLVPFPSALSLLVFHLPHAMVWMAENTRPMGADADEIWSSSETTMHNGPGSGDINTINAQYRFRAQFESLLDASITGKSAAVNSAAVNSAAVNISATRQVGATGTLRRQPWDNSIGTKEPHHLFGTEYWLSKGFDDRDTNPLSDSVELKPRARNQWPRPMSGSRPPPVSSQMQDSIGGPQLPSLLSSDPEAMPRERRE